MSSHTGKKSGRRILFWALKFAITAGLFVLIFRPDFFGLEKAFIPVSLAELWKTIQELQVRSFLPWFFAATLVKSCGMLCSVARWQLLLRGQGIRMGYFHLLGSFLVGRFFGIFLPGTMGLDAYCFYDAGRHSGKWIESAAVVAISKLTGFIALTLLVFLTLPLGLTFLNFKPVFLLIILIGLAGFLTVSMACLMRPRILQALIAIAPLSRLPGIESKLARLAQALTIYSGQKTLLLGALGLGLLVHFATTLMYLCAAMAIRTEGLRMAQILFASPLEIYATVIAPSVGGAGVREIMYVMLLGSHVGSAKAFLFGHLGFWAGESLSFLGGLVLMLRPAAYRPATDLSLIEQGRLPAPTPLSREETRRHRRDLLQTLAAALAGGAIGGALTGLFEGLWVVLTAQRLEDLGALPYAWAVHGLFGAAMGLGCGAAIAFAALWRGKFWSSKRTLAFSAAATFGAMGLVFARFRLIRDILGEQKPDFSDQIHLLLLAVLGFILVRVALGGLGRLRFLKWIGRPLGGAGLFVGVLLLLCIVAVVGKRRIPEYPPQQPSQGSLAEGEGLLLVIVDTLRADHLGAYGAQGIETPTLDALASEGVLFEQCIGQASWTRPSIATILTGMYPSTHGAIRKSDFLKPKVPILPEIIQKEGFYTAGLVNNFNIAPFFGFDRGYDHYMYLKPKLHMLASETASRLAVYEVLKRIRQKLVSRGDSDFIDVYDFYWPAEAVVDRAKTTIQRIAGGPFFFLLHFMDPHDPYMMHPLSQNRGYARLAFGEIPEEKRDEAHRAYIGEIEYLDTQLGLLVADLKARGLYDKIAIVLTADHGEEFLEHGGWWHGRTLYEEQIHVPLIVKLPGGRLSGQRISYPVRLLDVAPTICSLLGIQPPPAMQGHALIEKEAIVDPKLDHVFSEEDFEGNVLESLRGREWKLHLANEDNPHGLPSKMLFHLPTDPGEKADRSTTETHIAEPMKALVVKEQETARQAGSPYR